MCKSTIFKLFSQTYELIINLNLTCHYIFTIFPMVTNIKSNRIKNKQNVPYGINECVVSIVCKDKSLNVLWLVIEHRTSFPFPVPKVPIHQCIFPTILDRHLHAVKVCKFRTCRGRLFQITLEMYNFLILLWRNFYRENELFHFSWGTGVKTLWQSCIVLVFFILCYCSW